MATSHKAYTRSQNPDESGIEHNINNTYEDGYGVASSEPLEGSLRDGSYECPVTTVNELQNPISADDSSPTVIASITTNKADESVSTNLLDDLSLSDSSDNDDFGTSSSDEYICDTDESSSSTASDTLPAKKQKMAISDRNNITISKIPSATNGNTLENPLPGCSFWDNNRINNAEKSQNAPLPLNVKSTDDENSPAKNNRTTTPGRDHIIVPETPSPFASTSENPPPDCSFWERNGMNSAGKKRKPRKSVKERRLDRVKRKLFRNTGLEYNTSSGKLKKSRELRDLGHCRQKCKERLEVPLRKAIFEKYWSLGSYTSRTEFIARCIEVHRKKTSKSSPKKKRNVSFRYHVTDSNHIKY